MAESALVVLVPEAENYVSAIREQFDPSARLGVPAHITLLYPFANPAAIGASTLNALDTVFSAATSFSFHLATPARFPDALYLAPEPAPPLIAMIRAITARFPSYLPYGGQFHSVVPHLTVARGSSQDLAFAEQGLTGMLASSRIQARCQQGVLIENSSGRWKPMQAFPLATAGRFNR